MKNILCYGDSITWGLIPGSKFERYPFKDRWPGVLQLKYPDKIRVIEESLCARTLDSDDPRAGFEGRNGLTALPMILDSHYPLDLIIVMLGSNELKSIFSFTKEDIKSKLMSLVKAIKQRQPNFHKVNQKILLVTPPRVVENKTSVWGDLWIGAESKSEWFREIYKDVAIANQCDYLDIVDIILPGRDGVHLSIAGQKKLGEAII